MATDTTQVVYGCPFCSEFFRSETDARKHISDSAEGPHRHKNGFRMSETLDVRTPTMPDIDIDHMTDVALDWIEDNVGNVESSQYPEPVYVEGRIHHEPTGLPVPFVQYVAATETPYTVTRSDGLAVGSRLKTEWDDLTDLTKDSVIVKAYYAGRTTESLVEDGITKRTSDGQVYNDNAKWSWMLVHPDIDTPIYPTDDETGGEVKMEGAETVDDMLPEPDDIDWEKEGDYATAEDVDEALADIDQAVADAIDDVDERPRRSTDKVSGDAKVSTSAGVAFSEPDLTFEAIAALIETGRYEDARRMFDRATGAEEYDLRWEAPGVEQ